MKKIILIPLVFICNACFLQADKSHCINANKDTTIVINRTIDNISTMGLEIKSNLDSKANLILFAGLDSTKSRVNVIIINKGNCIKNSNLNDLYSNEATLIFKHGLNTQGEIKIETHF